MPCARPIARRTITMMSICILIAPCAKMCTALMTLTCRRLLFQTDLNPKVLPYMLPDYAPNAVKLQKKNSSKQFNHFLPYVF